jgi:hypothetical protein
VAEVVDQFAAVFHTRFVVCASKEFLPAQYNVCDEQGGCAANLLPKKLEITIAKAIAIGLRVELVFIKLNFIKKLKQNIAYSLSL